MLHDWKKWCTSAEFDEECALYDKAPVDASSVDTVVEDVQTVYISTLDRTFQTAEAIFGNRDFKRTSLINEVPLRSVFDTEVKMPLWFWNVLGRLQWFTGNKRQPETKAQTTKRADEFVKMISDYNECCAIVTHGFFMHTLFKVLEKEGFKADITRANYRNGEVILLSREEENV